MTELHLCLMCTEPLAEPRQVCSEGCYADLVELWTEAETETTEGDAND